MIREAPHDYLTNSDWLYDTMYHHGKLGNPSVPGTSYNDESIRAWVMGYLDGLTEGEHFKERDEFIRRLKAERPQYLPALVCFNTLLEESGD